MRDEGRGGCGTCNGYSHLGRRRFLELLGVGVAAVLSGCGSVRSSARGSNPGSSALTTATPAGGPTPSVSGTGPTPTPTPSVVTLDSIPAPRPGPARTIFHAPGITNQIALTIDDGTCEGCVAAYVAFAQQSGTHITFSPNGVVQAYWNPHAPVLRPLIEAGQVQIANHTFSHHDLRRMSAGQIEGELERNDAWIQQAFGVTTRPWYRPPYGYHSDRVDDTAGSVGYTNVLMWNGTYGDSNALSIDVFLNQAERYLTPGTIMLGHANHPTATELFDVVLALIKERNLDPVTLDEMFATSRAVG